LDLVFYDIQLINKVYCEGVLYFYSSSGGSKRLAQFGNLYGEEFHKITIGSDKINDMQSFLRFDREEIVKYALRDALISLIHSL